MQKNDDTLIGTAEI